MERDSQLRATLGYLGFGGHCFASTGDDGVAGHLPVLFRGFAQSVLDSVVVVKLGPTPRRFDNAGGEGANRRCLHIRTLMNIVPCSVSMVREGRLEAGMHVQRGGRQSNLKAIEKTDNKQQSKWSRRREEIGVGEG